MPGRSVGQGTASLASSIFLVARKRDSPTGAWVALGTLYVNWTTLSVSASTVSNEAGVSGSDLVIACVGAGILKPSPATSRVEQDNGDELPAERFLIIVQSRVLDAMFGDLARADGATRFYVASQFSYGYGPVPFDEMNNLAHMTGVELDGARGLTNGHAPLVTKDGSTVALMDFEGTGHRPSTGPASVRRARLLP